MNRFAVICVMLAAGVVAAPTNELPVRTIFSSTHRFAISGLSGVDSMTLARWAEDVADRLERVLGTSIPFEAGEVLIIRGLEDSRAARPVVEKVQGYFDGRLQQKLVIVRPSGMDQEDALEALCALLLNRCLLARQPVGQRQPRGAVAPDWLSVGLAQNLFKELRARNAGIVQELRDAGNLPAAAEVLDWTVLPPGRWREKYCAGLFVSWLMAQPDTGDRWAGLLRHLAAGGDAGAHVRSAFLRLSDAAALQQEWNRWVSRQGDVIFEVGGMPARMLEELEGLFVLRPRELGVAATNLPPEIMALELIKRRAEPAVAQLAAAAAVKARLVAAGQSEEAARAAETVAAFYTRLARAGKSRGWFGAAPGEAELNGLLAEARKAVMALRKAGEERDRYLNAVDRWVDLQREAAAGAPSNAPAAGDDARRYLDDVERALSAPDRMGRP